MYFDSCKSEKEINILYKQLALKNHPDHGGSLYVMQTINIERTNAINRLQNPIQYPYQDFYRFVNDIKRQAEQNNRYVKQQQQQKKYIQLIESL